MKAQIRLTAQPDSIVVRLSNPAALADLEQDAALVRLMLVNDPAYQAWSEQRQIESELAYDAWLTSPEGQRWLESEASAYDEQHGLTAWEGW